MKYLPKHIINCSYKQRNKLKVQVPHFFLYSSWNQCDKYIKVLLEFGSIIYHFLIGMWHIGKKGYWTRWLSLAINIACTVDYS